MRIMDYIHQGGAIMYILLAFNIIGFTILIWKIMTIVGFRKNLSAVVAEIKSLAGKDSVVEGAQLTLVKDEVSSRVHGLENGLNTVKIIASVSPLLGLLGTVVGILSSFQVIAQKGLSDPSLFAGGISMALITTVGGLVVAIPHFIGYNYIVSALDDLEMKLEKILLKDMFKKKEG